MTHNSENFLVKKVLGFRLLAFVLKKVLSFRLSAFGFKKVLGFRLWAFGFSLLLFVNANAQFPLSPQLQQMLSVKEMSTAFVGVYVYDDSSKKEIASYQSDKYFVPASNTKLFSLYAGMKYLGDSIEGISYTQVDTALFVFAMGDPTFLHPDFQSQPVFDFLKKTDKKIYLVCHANQWHEKPWGPGWAWDDYNDDYAVERSPFPIYGNFIRWTQQKSENKNDAAFGPTVSVSSLPEVPWKVRYSNDSLPKTFQVKRLMDSNVFIIRAGNEPDIKQDVPFITNDLQSAAELLRDTLGKMVYSRNRTNTPMTSGWKVQPEGSVPERPDINFGTIYSRPVDSVFVPMMYNSDNFFAEQTLLMVSEKQLFTMNDDSITAVLLNGPLADLPQKPSWADGSGLSRFNLFTPQDFVSLLIKFKNEFGMDRMKRILPTGGKGTLKNYYRADSGYIFAKTGSLNNVLCLSGYIYTKNDHLLEFSILVNNHTGSGSAVRHAVENYVEFLRRNN
ncbi:MAG TPA: D-alanyl-D-alanine carboxypeptidase [Puia sp.]|nr:D-alanyl-D-alanine carboxypeptidase [Puia sp.]